MSDIAGDPRHRPELSKLWIFALLVAVFAVYAPTLGNDFTLDDKSIARTTLPNGQPNVMVAEVRPLSEYFTSGYWTGYSGKKSSLYRPFTVLSYAMTNAWFGAAATTHHLINIFLHVWAVLLAFLLLTRLSIRRFPALFGSAAFGLNAIHSEVVAGIVGRAELLAFCLGAQALLLLFPKTLPSRNVRISKTAASAALLFLAFCSKESALAWAPFIAVYAIADDLAHQRRVARGRVLAVLAIALPSILAFAFLRNSAVGEITQVVHYYANPLAHVDTTTRVLSGVMIWGFGLLTCIFPFHLISDYGPVTFELVETFGEPRFIQSCAVLVGSFAFGIALARRHPLIFLAMACFLGFSFATSNVLFAIGTIFGERLYFTPSLGLGIFVAWIASNTERRLVLLPLAAMILMSSGKILWRNGAWASDADLFASDVSTGTQCVRVLDQRAQQLRGAGKADEAEKLWRRAIKLDPEYPDALFNFASQLGATRRFTEAEALLERAIATPDYRSPRRHIYRRNLSVLFELTNRKEQSVQQLRLAWQEDSAFEAVWEPLVERTVLHLSPEEIKRIIATGEERNPGHATWVFLAASLDHRRGDFAAAQRGFQRALAIRPGHARTRLERARSLIAAGRRDDAVPILRELAADSRAPNHIRQMAQRMAR